MNLLPTTGESFAQNSHKKFHAVHSRPEKCVARLKGLFPKKKSCPKSECKSFWNTVPDEDKWKTETKTEGGAIQEYLVSYQNLVPKTDYTFRVIAYNKYGISLPAKSSDTVSERNNGTSRGNGTFLVCGTRSRVSCGDQICIRSLVWTRKNGEKEGGVKRGPCASIAECDIFAFA